MTPNAFTTKPPPPFTKDDLLRMAKTRAGSKGGTVKNERNDAKSATYINTRTK